MLSSPPYSSIVPQMDFSKPSWHQLLIIGNGFDLECGLASRFSDFAATRNELFSAFCAFCDSALNGGFPGKYPEVCNRLTAWDIVLSSEQGNRWNDVESSISSWVMPSTKNGHIFDSKLDELIGLLREVDGETRDCLLPPKMQPYYGRERRLGLLADYFSVKHSLSPIPCDRSGVLAFLLSELHRLECEFEEYLSEVVAESDDYRKRSRTLLSELGQDRCASTDEFDIEESILSFNYTRPLADLWCSTEPVPFANVHGHLGGEIVFGIDGKDLMGDPDALPYTKTYRLMNLNAAGEERIVYPAVGFSGEAATDVIKFYGHSLSPADYSYFQAIFDSVDLYSGQTHLIFYYRAHGGQGDHESQLRRAKEDTMRSATRLLVTYGKSMDNSEHGKNLIHKLLLEGRLLVTELPRVNTVD